METFGGRGCFAGAQQDCAPAKQIQLRLSTSMLLLPAKNS